MYGALLDAVRGVRWPARRAVRTGATGVHGSRVRGYGAEFTEYRAYRAGDPLGKVDWKLFARSGRTSVRLSTERAVLPTSIVLDASASMAFPVPSHDKWEMARQLTIALAGITHASGDPVGLVMAERERLTSVPPSTRRDVVPRLAGIVSGIVPAGARPLAPALADAARTSARVAIVSDFLGDVDAMLADASVIAARGGEVHVVHVVAVEELDPRPGTTLVSDPEAPDERRAFGDAAAYREAFALWRAELADRWRAAGASFATAVAGRDPVEQCVRRIVAPPGTVAVA